MTDCKESLIEQIELLKEYTGPYGIETPEQAIDRCIAIIRHHATPDRSLVESIREMSIAEVEGMDMVAREDVLELVRDHFADADKPIRGHGAAQLWPSEAVKQQIADNVLRPTESPDAIKPCIVHAVKRLDGRIVPLGCPPDCGGRRFGEIGSEISEHRSGAVQSAAERPDGEASASATYYPAQEGQALIPESASGGADGDPEAALASPPAPAIQQPDYSKVQATDGLGNVTTFRLPSVEEAVSKNMRERGFTGLCSAHRDGEDPECDICYPKVKEQPDGIPVIDDRFIDEVLFPLIYSCFPKAIFPPTASETTGEIIKVVRPYLRIPVEVDIAAGARAVAAADVIDKPDNMISASWRWKKHAKACAEAWGLKWTETS